MSAHFRLDRSSNFFFFFSIRDTEMQEGQFNIFVFDKHVP